MPTVSAQLGYDTQHVAATSVMAQIPSDSRMEWLLRNLKFEDSVYFNFSKVYTGKGEEMKAHT